MTNSKIFYSKNFNDFNNMEDEELVTLAKNKNVEALDFLMEKYSENVNAKVSKYFINGGERDDLVQEGMIGLFKAVKSYEADKDSSFKNFANLCIERQLITTIKGSNRQKNIPLNTYISLNNSLYEDEEGNTSEELINYFNSNTSEDPLDTLTKSEYYEYVQNRLANSLSDFEKDVLGRFVEGKSYTEIAGDLNSEVKSVDNAIQRIRKKSGKFIKKDL